jgi:small-conductance mechanosensitive channel
MKELWERVRATLDRPILGNNLGHWVLAFGVTVLAYIAIRIVVRSVARRLAGRAEKQGSRILGFLSEIVRRTSFFTVLLAALVAGTQFVELPGQIATLLRHLLVVAALLQGGLWAALLLEKFLQFRMSAQKEASRSTAVTLLTFSGKLLLWGFIVLLSLENLGIDVTALIAGLGVGGIAIALAAQNILGDLFASITILLDKPFVVGDSIVLGDFAGNVEHIGVKTTRLRSVTGEQIIIGNHDLVSSRVRNFKRLTERRQIFTIGITYDTPAEQVESVAATLREIVTSIPDTRFDRSHFKSFEDSALLFEVVYFVKKPDFNALMDVQQKINLEIYRRFAAEGIEFAYPTQVVHQATPQPPPPAAPQKELSRG